MREWRVVRTFLFAAVGALVLAGCGGGGGGDAKDASAPPTTTTTASASATTSKPAAAAKVKGPSEGPALALTADDLGGEWKVATPAPGVQDAPPDNCAKTIGGLHGLVDGGRYGGAVLQRGTSNYYVGSTTYVFGDEAAAQAEVASRGSKAYQDCRIDQLTKGEQAASPGVDGASFRLSNVNDAKGDGQNGFELQYDFQFQATIDGKLQDANGIQQFVLYRHGRHIVEYGLKGSFAEGDSQEHTSGVYAEFATAIDAAQTRAPTT